jgi:hypothetical protein
MRSWTILPCAALLLVPALVAAQEIVKKPYFGIHVVDEATEQGVPLIELRTVNDIAVVTDSAGWVAFNEPGLMDREVYFGVDGPGYEHTKDGFGFRGVRLTTTPGKTATIKVQRTNVAERMYRVTGQGIFRDTELLGLATPAGVPALNAGVVGQDSVQAVPYRDRIFWLWGDTNLANYPLGNFQTTAATSPVPGKDFDFKAGLPLKYFLAEPEVANERMPRLRAMAPLPGPGVVWLFGLLTIDDPSGEPALVAHYSRRKGLAEELEHGLVRFNDHKGVFEKLVSFDLDDHWRFPTGNARLVQDSDGKYFYFSGPFANRRVPADWKSLQDPQAYQALAYDSEQHDYRWQSQLPAATQSEERKLIEAGKLSGEKARYQLIDITSERPMLDLHHSSIAWNAYRKKWILIGVQQDATGKPSHLGELWYAESDHISGPWQKGIKIASHPHYSFYNPRQHTFLDEERGRFIYFEGTYARTFSGNSKPTPRYEYNQLMYRLDLADERLQAVR